jgi:hypothetical protein
VPPMKDACLRLVPFGDRRAVPTPTLGPYSIKTDMSLQ